MTFDTYNKLTIRPPEDNQVINGAFTKELEDSFSIYVPEGEWKKSNISDYMESEWDIVFTSNSDEGIEWVSYIAGWKPEFGFQLKFTDHRFEKKAGDITWDAGEIFTEEVDNNLTFDSYFDMGFSVESYFKLHVQDEDTIYKLSHNPQTSAKLINALYTYLSDGLKRSDDSMIMQSLMSHRNFDSSLSATGNFQLDDGQNKNYGNINKKVMTADGNMYYEMDNGEFVSPEQYSYMHKFMEKGSNKISSYEYEYSENEYDKSIKSFTMREM